ncbi:hypothetical protein KUA50_008150 [Segatella hominis]|uniref:hypothetical protein n=1 Tax=Segatella hominis TaxID=2518605 RepID=UPI001C471307|nr:hypothetical protein [Segatella hominis]WOZ80059.1 hypothetical protein KUA50_008150 [Segatella hominis]
MKKILTMLFSLLTVVILSSCDEVKDSPLLFKATSNTNPEYISVSYYPEEIGYTLYPKESKYFIYSYTYIDGDLELTCTNCDNINYSLDCSFGIVKNNKGKNISATEEEVGVSVKNTDNKTLRIHFAKLKDEDLPLGFLGARATIKVYGRVGGKDVTTNISVYRSNLRKQPDDDVSKK